MAIAAYLWRRVAQIPIVILVMTLLVFGLMRVTPGDPAAIMLGVYATPETIAAVRQEFNLDRSLPAQYLLWLKRLLIGDLGQSIRTRDRVGAMIRSRLPISILLAAAATMLSVLVAVPAGMASATRQNSPFDYTVTLLTMAGFSIPNFALALLLIFVFAMHLQWVPVTGIGFVSFRDHPWGAVVPFMLPVIALGVFHIAEMTRLLRSSLIDVLKADYITVAVAKGLRFSSVLTRHALKNSLIPLVTVAAISFTRMVGTSITVEHVFAIPGMGSALIQAVFHRDFPVIQGFTLMVGLLLIVTNILADVAYAYLDPRIRYG